jgi:hypothetical protein
MPILIIRTPTPLPIAPHRLWYGASVSQQEASIAHFSAIIHRKICIDCCYEEYNVTNKTTENNTYSESSTFALIVLN